MLHWYKYIALLCGLTLGACTTTDPYTGQNQVDQARTAALISGLALAGAAAYAINQDREKDERRHDEEDWHFTDSTVFYPRSGIACYAPRRTCYKENGKLSKKWTDRIYPRSAYYRYDYSYKRHNN